MFFWGWVWWRMERFLLEEGFGAIDCFKESPLRRPGGGVFSREVPAQTADHRLPGLVTPCPGAGGRHRDDALECRMGLCRRYASGCSIEPQQVQHRPSMEVQYQPVSFTLTAVLLGGAHPGRPGTCPSRSDTGWRCVRAGGHR